MGRIFISTAIPYANSSPHIGFAEEILQADVLARHYRQEKNQVFFLTGTDENALKNVQAAETEGVTTKELLDKYAPEYQELKTILDISFDDFIRTTEERHIKGVQRFWNACKKDIYKKSYKGQYCVGCEEFKTEKDLIDGKCIEHKKPLESVEEENYFFALSKYENEIRDLINSNELLITPDFRKKEILEFIDQGLKDFSISRSVKRAKGWGIPVPEDDSQVIYVWFDALINYITGLGYVDGSKLYKDFWLSKGQKIHILGKGVFRFHAIYWIGMLLSAGLPLPTKEFIHEYITIDGEKISKSLGNVIFPKELVNKYGTDPVRYFFLKEIKPFRDGDFSHERFEEVYQADLANGLGNLAARVAAMGVNFEFEALQPKLKISEAVADKIEIYEFDKALRLIWDKIKKCDTLINKRGVWKLEGQKKHKVLSTLVNEIRQIGVDLQPFLPETAKEILSRFGGEKIIKGKALFPRLAKNDN